MTELNANYFTLLAAAFTAGAATGLAIKGRVRNDAVGNLETVLGVAGLGIVAPAGKKSYCDAEGLANSDLIDRGNLSELKNWLAFVPVLAAYSIGTFFGYGAG